MATEIKVPVLPESVSDASSASWNKKVGDAVKRDENLVDLETDKVVLEVPSTVEGVIKELKFEEGATVTSQQVIAVIEEGAAAEAPKEEAKADKHANDKKTAVPATTPQKPAAGAEDDQPKTAAGQAGTPAKTENHHHGQTPEESRV